MQTELLKKLNNILKDFPKYWEEDHLKRNQVIEDINAKQPELIKALIKDEKIKELYSTEIDGILIFDFHKLIALLKYKEYWQNSYTKFRNKIGLTSDGKYLSENTDVVLDFPFKDCVLEGGMSKEDKGKTEIYYNEIIAKDEIDRLFSPKVLANAKRYTKDGVYDNITDFSEEDNLIIKGNNLIALHSLKARYKGKVKLIYIDPPYNTGNDSFKYNDRFNHSTWLTFMKNRLEIARELLSDDGFILVHIDDNEAAYLKVLMDGIFGLNNFRNNIIWSYRTGGIPTKGRLPKKHDSIILYSKSALSDFKLIKERQYLEKSFMGSSVDENARNYVDTNIRDVLEGIINVIYSNKIIPFNVRPVLNLSSENIENFRSQKPEGLLHFLLELLTNENDLVLDFCVGTGTTLRVAHKIKRKYIGIEQMDYINEITVPRLQKVIDGEQGGISKEVNWQGGGGFVYCELKQLNYSFIEQINQAKDYSELLPIFVQMKESAHLNFQVDLEELMNEEYEVNGDETLVAFKDLKLEEQKELLISLLDKNQLYVNESEMEDQELNIAEEDKQFTKKFYERS